ncbi:MAG TPA: hypothetical protein DEA49_01325 [Petrotoga sp.]|nr:MAG: Shikimate kinase [Petrotoga mobilis]HBT50744.1 hypothetical protein [Petrotoga sp.]
MKIFLVGMMGSGKTTLAKKISKVLSIPHIDIDEEIEENENLKIKDIFKKHGEEYFRKLESSILEKLAEKAHSFVVSTGGGIILSAKNRAILKKENTIYLKVTPEKLKERVSLENRPLLANNKENIIKIYKDRKELYEQFKTVDITNLNEWESVAKILYQCDIKNHAEIDSSFQKAAINAGSLKFLPPDSIVFTSEKVDELYGEYLPKQKLVLPNGEKTKDISFVIKAYEYLLENNVSRGNLLLGIGGGTITDFTGFVGSTYKRGMNFWFYPTTLLSQIDAAIGGKNGIDFKKYKNVVGTINLPKEVVIDPLSLLSLDKETFIEGLIEGYKMALISGNDFYDYFKVNLHEILNRNLDKLSFFIKRSIEEKLKIVEQDFKDTGLRSCLNLGHTLGHAFEAATGIAHGLSVGWGLIKEIEFFYKKKYLQEKYYLEIKDTLETLIPQKVRNIQIEERDIYHYVSNDKKLGANQKIKMPILKAPGNIIIEEIKLKEGETF